MSDIKESFFTKVDELRENKTFLPILPDYKKIKSKKEPWGKSHKPKPVDPDKMDEIGRKIGKVKNKE
jgi:hypothetical protein